LFRTPLLVLIGRLLQGFSAGVELGGVSVYLSEMATPGHKGFYASWRSASQQVAIIVSAAFGFALNAWLSPQQVDDWGWRIPFFVGCMIVPFLCFIRRSLQETDEFLAGKHHSDRRSDLSLDPREVGDRALRHDDGHYDDSFILPHHRLYAHLLEVGFEAFRHRQSVGHLF
jgi:MFS family permease